MRLYVSFVRQILRYHTTAVTLIRFASALLCANISQHRTCSVVSWVHTIIQMFLLPASRSQYWQFVPHGRWPGPSHGVTGQRDDRWARHRTARGAALMIPSSPPCPINLRPYVPPSLPLLHAFLVKTTGLENSLQREYIMSIFVKDWATTSKTKETL